MSIRTTDPDALVARRGSGGRPQGACRPWPIIVRYRADYVAPSKIPAYALLSYDVWTMPRRSFGGKELPNYASRCLHTCPSLLIGIIHAYQSNMDCKKRILVVEDNAESRELLAIILRRSGYDIAEAATGLDAVDQAHASRPDLIIMDLGLPGITGDEVTTRLKADASTRDIPVIVNTGFHRGSLLVERAIVAGASMILHKPTPLKVFVEVARRYLSPEYMIDASCTTAEH